MHLPGSRSVANYDPEGLIFAVGINSEMVKLYDLKSFDKVSLIYFLIARNFYLYAMTCIFINRALKYPNTFFEK